uniref:Ribosomal protein L6 n=1 Tax=Entransia fimbriata TaxID=130991 RepID=U5YF10_9VIRI|nr:ribosomal protein L6 [Entransia fimbriata]AGZ90302.1 ribosomal protein L6 [Entransia fimbriata]
MFLYLEIVGVGYKATILNGALCTQRTGGAATRHTRRFFGPRMPNCDAGSCEESCVADFLQLKLGFSHEVNIKIPSTLRVFCLTPTLICCYGLEKQKVTEFAASLKKIRPPEPYKGKGIRLRHEVILKKQGAKLK